MTRRGPGSASHKRLFALCNLLGWSLLHNVFCGLEMKSCISVVLLPYLSTIWANAEAAISKVGAGQVSAQLAPPATQELLKQHWPHDV